MGERKMIRIAATIVILIVLLISGIRSEAQGGWWTKEYEIESIYDYGGGVFGANGKGPWPLRQEEYTFLIKSYMIGDHIKYFWPGNVCSCYIREEPWCYAWNCWRPMKSWLPVLLKPYYWELE